MYTAEALLDLHERVQRVLKALLEHCAGLDAEALHRELAGFGYPTVQLQLHHVIGGERYWVGVLRGEMRVEEDEADFPSVADLENLRVQVAAETRAWLSGRSARELNEARELVVWGGRARRLVPALVLMRPITHVHHHAGQVAAMCRLLGHPLEGVDFPLD